MHFDELVILLEQQRQHVDQSEEWPSRELNWLAEANVMKWGIPEEFGGTSVSDLDVMHGYRKLSTACLTTCFILTQRNAAVSRIVASKADAMKKLLLPDLAAGRIFTTVGISHLSTSRQHWQRPAVEVLVLKDSLLISGEIPWVTGAAHAQYIVTGGTCDDGKQVLLVLPTDHPGVTIGDSAELMALNASLTASVQLDQVQVPREHLLFGPVEQVMSFASGKEGTGSLTTSVLAMGLSARALRMVQQQAEKRPDLKVVVDEFQKEFESLWALIEALVEGTSSKNSLITPAEARQRANSFVLRMTQAAMLVSKGAGYLRGHEAELAVREAMFFLVWSCPHAVVQGLLKELTGVADNS